MSKPKSHEIYGYLSFISINLSKIDSDMESPYVYIVCVDFRTSNLSWMLSIEDEVIVIQWSVCHLFRVPLFIISFTRVSRFVFPFVINFLFKLIATHILKASVTTKMILSKMVIEVIEGFSLEKKLIPFFINFSCDTSPSTTT